MKLQLYQTVEYSIRLTRLAGMLLVSIFFAANTHATPTDTRPNVLFIAIDDLRPDLGCYGNRQVVTPNLDRMAEQGILFRRHYVTQPTCGASRYTLLTGKLPRTRIELRNDAIEKQISGRPKPAVPATFIEMLKDNGYYTVGIGKISNSADGYVYGYTEQKSDQPELPHTWDEILFNPGKWKTGWNAFFGYADGENRQSKNGKVKPYEKGDVEDNGYPDGLTAELAIEKLGELSKRKQPFFIGVGFFKPHLPFTAPAKYWDLYDADTLMLSPSPGLPVNVSKASLQRSGEFNSYLAGDERAGLEASVSDDYARKLRHAYYASVSYADAQAGKVLKELHRLGLDKNTIIVVWGDHGWHLGDHRVWGKHTLFERSLRSVFLMKVPGYVPSVINEIVSTVDIYPTLIELCLNKVPEFVDGTSLLPLMKNKDDPGWKNLAFSYFNNGITLRTNQYRFTRYFRDEAPVVELYDHLKDPLETINIAAENPEIVNELTRIWEKGNTGLYD